MAETRPENYPRLTNYQPTKFMLPTSHYDEKKADKAVNFIEQLCHTKGKWAGQRFWLLPWQEQIIRDVFGIVKEDGTRQFRTAFVEICKKVGKSELAAAVALYMLYADNEPSAEVYGAAADRQQASIVFDVAKRMVDMTPALLRRSKILAAQKRIVNYDNAGFYQVLSAEVGCVLPNTIIQMEDGSIKTADKVRAGDRILAYDGVYPVFDEVVSVREEEPSEVLEVITKHNRKTCVTKNYPFWAMLPGRRMQDLTHQYDWLEAEQLKKNTRVAVALGWPKTEQPKDSISTLEAWALGAWAGDGDCTHFRFINPDEPVIQKLRLFFNEIGSDLKSTYSTRQKQEGKYTYQEPIEHLIMGVGKRRKSPGREWVRHHFGQENTAHTKKIPDAVWKGGTDVWAAFLAGYIDTDGFSGKSDAGQHNGTGASICSVSEDMTRGCQILFVRLGINASTHRKYNASVSGKPQLRKLWHLLSPYMVHEKKRDRLQALSEIPIYAHQRANESDKVEVINNLGLQRTISFEMKTYQTHATDGLITHNTKHGLNVSSLIFDEIHAQPNRNLYDVLTKGSSDARQNPVHFIITTAGTDRNSIGYELHTKAVDVLNERRVDPSFYPVVYSLPDDADWEDENNWYKINPSLGITVPIDRMRDAFREAKQNPADEVTFRWLRLNQWVSSTTAWIPDQVFMQGNVPIDMRSLEGRDCYGGLDLSSSEDITAFVLCFPPRNESEKYIILPFMWVPEETIPRRERRTSVPYSSWVQQGYMMSTKGNVIDYAFIEAFIDDLGKKYHIREIAFDRWGAVEMVQHLEGEGFTVVPFGQGYRDMSPALKAFYELMMKGEIIHGGHPVLRWMAGNVVIDTDPAGNIKPTKKCSPDKIDGIVAAIMALDRCIRHEEQGSVYDERDLFVI